MKILREVEEGDCFPSPWWGLCWHDYNRRLSVIAPIGVNLLLAFARWSHGWVAYYLPQRLHRMRHEWERSNNDRKLRHG